MSSRAYKSNKRDTALVDEITTQLMLSVGDWYGAGSYLNVVRPEIRPYRNCLILRYPLSTSRGTQKTILVKIRRKPNMDALWQAVDADIHQNIPKEYASLVSVYGDLANLDPDLGVIRPLTYLEKYHAIVMEEFPSVTLRQLLIKNRHAKRLTISNELIDAATKTGRWLRLFHQRVHQPVEKNYTAEDIRSLLARNTALLQMYTRGRVDAQSILDAFDAKLENVQIRSMKFSQSPADMTCNNVLYSVDRKVCVIDIQTRLAPIYSDLGLILAYPETFKIQILSAGTYLPETLLGKYRAAILDGYFGIETFDSSLVSIYTAVAIVYKWRMYEEMINKYKGVKYLFSLLLGSWVTSYFLKTLTKHLAAIGVPETGYIPPSTNQAEPSASVGGEAT